MALSVRCPRCGSPDVRIIPHRGTVAKICNTCGYDERDEIDIDVVEKTNQKAKGSYSPYKTGGSSRTRKK